MVDPDKFDCEASDPKNSSGSFRKDLRVVQQVVFFQFQFNERSRKRGRIDRDIQFLQYIRNRSDVVLVAGGR